jgi:hypothetical protein
MTRAGRTGVNRAVPGHELCISGLMASPTGSMQMIEETL